MKQNKDLDQLSQHTVPDWFHDAKFGIFVHWGPYSVPAYAPVGDLDIAGLFASGDIQSVFRNQPYAEWYLNSIRIPNSPAARFHAKTYGSSKSYDDFVSEFNESSKEWKPAEWANLFQQAGAKYVVLVTKHHDGFTLWPSKFKNPKKPNYHSERDIVGELTREVTSKGLKMGCYYSGLLDWTYTNKPIIDFVDLMTNTPTSQEYVTYQENHWRELIDRYEPSILWSDIGYPPGSNPGQLMKDFYNKIPEGIVNDRWVQVSPLSRFFMKLPFIRSQVNNQAIKAFSGQGGNPMKPVHADFTTPEYTSLQEILPTKWESTRGIGRSFAYNQYEPAEMYLTLPDLIESFIDIVSKNGNLLLNVGPQADGSIPDIQLKLLQAFGKEMEHLGEGIYGTRPFKTFGYDGNQGEKIRYTQKHNQVYCFVFPGNLNEMIVDLDSNISNTDLVPLSTDIAITKLDSGNKIKISISKKSPSGVFLLKSKTI